eukprot:gene5630-4047_t
MVVPLSDDAPQNLRNRILQLESELRYTKEALYCEKGKKDELEGQLDSLQEEANHVVHQWEAKLAQEKNNAEKLQTQLTQLREQYVLEESKNKELEKLIQKTKNDALIEQQRCIMEKEKIEKELKDAIENYIQQICSLRNERSNAIKKAGDLNIELEQFKGRLSQEVACKDLYEKELGTLKVDLQRICAENSTLKQHLKQVSGEAQKLLSRTSQLNDKNASLESEKEALQSLLQSKNIDTESLRTQLKNLEQMNEMNANQKQEYETRLRNLETQIEKDHKKFQEEKKSLEEKLKEALEIATNQSHAFSQLQLKYKDAETEQRKASEKCADINNTLLSLNEAFQKEQSEKRRFQEQLVDFKAQLAIAQHRALEAENNSAALLDQERAKHEKALQDVILSRSLIEKNYKSLLISHNSLADVIAADQLRILSLQERSGRLNLIIPFLDEYNKYTCNFSAHALRECSANANALSSQQAKQMEIEVQLRDIKSKFLSAKDECDRKDHLLRDRTNQLEASQKMMSEAANNLEKSRKVQCTLEKDNTFLKEQVDALTKELNDMDAIIIAQVNEFQDINDKLKLENKKLRTQVEELTVSNEDLTQHLSVAQQEFDKCHSTLELTESELIVAKNKEHTLSSSLCEVKIKLGEEEAKTAAFSAEKAKLESGLESLRMRLEQATERFNLILSDKNDEIEMLRERLTKSVELVEKHESSMTSTHQAIQNYETNITALKNAYAKLKAKYLKDSEARGLLQEQQNIKEKYNQLHESFSNSRKEAAAKVSEAIKKVVSLCAAQEADLQKLRRQNLLLKNSLSMFVTTTQPKAETVFTERLNLTEGPLRHPKKRVDKQSQSKRKMKCETDDNRGWQMETC